jgi:hypothetical protein
VSEFESQWAQNLLAATNVTPMKIYSLSYLFDSNSTGRYVGE